jgi:hypothetical protein
MSSTIVTKNSSTASAVPVTGDLTQGELAVNVTDKKLYTKDSGGTVVKLVGGLGNQEANAVAITGGSINGTTVGATTASTGAFTTLSASSTVSGTGFSTYLASPPAIGGTAAAAGSFTTLSASSTTTLSGGTANGVAYLNGSKVLTTGSALTFNGNTLSVVGTAPGVAINDSTASVGVSFSWLNGGASYSYGQLGLRDVTNSQTAYTYFAGASGYHNWFQNGSEQMRLTSTGLGIGTSSPSTKLHIKDSTGTAVNLLRLETPYSNPSGNKSIIWTDATDTLGRISVSYTAAGGSQMSFGSLYSGGYQTSDLMVLTSSGNLGLGVTPSAWASDKKVIQLTNGSSFYSNTSVPATYIGANFFENSGGSPIYSTTAAATQYYQFAGSHVWRNAPSGTAGNAITFTQAMTLDASGNLLVGKTATTFSAAGSYISYAGKGVFTVDADEVLLVNRLTNDGNLIRFYQAGTEEGNISVSGTTVSYNGGHLSRWAQMLTKPELLKGTVMSNLDEMNVYTDSDGNPVQNEQLNKVKVSDVEGDVNVAGVFVNWGHDDAHNVDEINMAMTGDMIIRIAQGVTVQRGDLLMSAGDGTAKPQGDDIRRSKTIAKVTSTHVTCTYADGSYCVPCVLMAC